MSSTEDAIPMRGAPSDSGAKITPDPSFIQSQISLQRNPSIARVNESLSRNSSIRSNASYDAGLSSSSILGVKTLGDPSPVDLSRSDSSGSCPDGFGNCDLRKSSSSATDRSIMSTRSTRSVQSLQAIGAFPFGTLRIHEDGTEAEAPEYLTSGDVILINNIVPGVFFGFDTVGFTVGKDGQFQGVKDTPVGAHFIYAGSGDLSVRSGYWIISSPRDSNYKGQVHLKRWDRHTEALEEEVSLAETRIQKENVPAIIGTLMPYSTVSDSKTTQTGQETPCANARSPSGSISRISPPIPAPLGSSDETQQVPTRRTPESSAPSIWPRLTNCVDGAILSRITGHNWNKWRVTSTDDSKPSDKDTCSSKSHQERNLDHLTAHDDRVLSFLFTQNSTTFSSEVTGRQRTEQALDTSSHVNAIIVHHCTSSNHDEIVGELQFCFLTGMLLGNVACMEQWGWVIKVLFKAYRLAMDEPVLFQKIIAAFHAQLIFNEESLDSSIFEYDLSLEDELKIILTTFKSRLNEQLLIQNKSLSPEQEEVGKAFESLETYLWKLEWDLRGNYVRSGKIQLEDGEYVDAEMEDFEAEDERGEYAPQIVDIDDFGNESGLLRWDN